MPVDLSLRLLKKLSFLHWVAVPLSSKNRLGVSLWVNFWILYSVLSMRLSLRQYHTNLMIVVYLMPLLTPLGHHRAAWQKPWVSASKELMGALRISDQADCWYLFLQKASLWRLEEGPALSNVQAPTQSVKENEKLSGRCSQQRNKVNLQKQAFISEVLWFTWQRIQNRCRKVNFCVLP